MDLPEILTIQDVAEFLKVDEDTVRTYINREINSIPVMKLSPKTIRILKSDLLEWMEQSQNES